jgi:TonB family protein
MEVTDATTEPSAPPDLGTGARARATMNGALPSALAASFAIHVGAFAAVAAVAAWPQAAAVPAASAAPPALRVVLASTASSALPLPPVPPPVASGAAERTVGVRQGHPPSESAAEWAAAAQPSSTGRGPQRSAAGRGVPRVVVDDQVPRAPFADALDPETLSGIPVEVDVPVRLPGKLVVPYPPDALAARREGVVLAWSIVDENGTAEDPRVVAGPPEFAESVKAALRATRFAPARDGGAPVRSYITLRFDFRIEPATAVAARAAGR